MPNKKCVTIMLASIALAGPLAACSVREGSLITNDNLETGAIEVTADNCLGLTATSGATVVLEDGDVLSISPMLEKGSVQVRLTEGSLTEDGTAIKNPDGTDGGDVALEETISGKATSTYELEPGEYTVSVVIPEGVTADGTVAIRAVDKTEPEHKQHKSLQEAIRKADDTMDFASGRNKDDKKSLAETLAEKTGIGAKAAKKATDEVTKSPIGENKDADDSKVIKKASADHAKKVSEKTVAHVSHHVQSKKHNSDTTN